MHLMAEAVTIVVDEEEDIKEVVHPHPLKVGTRTIILLLKALTESLHVIHVKSAITLDTPLLIATTAWITLIKGVILQQHLLQMATSNRPPLEQQWYTNTGATDHVTFDIDNLSLRSDYQGSDKVSVGNGGRFAYFSCWLLPYIYSICHFSS